MGSKKRKKASGNPALRQRSSAHDQPHTRAETRGVADEPAGPDVPGVNAYRRAGQASDSPAARSRTTRRSARRQTSAVEALLQMPVDEHQTTARGWLPDVLEEMEPQTVVATYTFVAPQTESFTAAIRFTGVHTGIEGDPGPRDQFQRIEQLDDLPGDGQQVSLTTRIDGVNKGDWRVLAQPVGHPDGTQLGTPQRMIETHSHHGALAQGPGVHLWAWPLLVGLGAVVALLVQALLAGRSGYPVLGVLGISILGCLLGFVGGKLWYLGLHRKPLRQILHSGACIQGFLLAALGVLTLGSLAAGFSVGAILDLTTPGIFLGVAVGRPGCWFTGCCAGRPTRSRWGLVSSNRRLRLRRFPVQLYEALGGLVIGIVSLVTVLGDVPVAGSVFVAAIAAYTLVRQLLFGLRVESRTRTGRLITIAISGLFLLGAAGTFLA